MPSSYIISIILKAATGEAKKELERFGRDLDIITKGAKETSIAFGAIAAAGTALIAKTTLTAARTEELGVVIDNLGRVAGYTQEELDAHEESIKDLGITTQGARTIMSRFMGAELDLADAAKIARAAQDLAVIGMQDSSEAAETLTYAIASMQPRVLRQYGLFVNLNDVYERTAATLGKTAEELTEAEQRQGMLNAVLEQAGNFAGTYEAAMETGGKQLRSFGRYAEKASEEFGEYFLPYLSEAVEVATDLAKAFINAEDATQKSAAQLILYTTAAAGAMSATSGLMVAGKSLIPIMSFLWGPAGLAVLAVGATAALTAAMYSEYLELIRQKQALLDAADSARDYRDAALEAEKATVGQGRAWRGGATLAHEYAEAEHSAGLEAEWNAYQAEQYAAAYVKGAMMRIDAEKLIAQAAQETAKIIQQANQDAVISMGGAVLDLRDNIEAYNELKNTTTTVYADTSGIISDFNSWREGEEAGLQEKLVELEQDRADKIAWVQAGAHARSAQENEEALAYWNAIYDEEAQKLRDAVNEKIGLREEEKIADIGAAQAAAAEKSRLAEEARQAEMRALEEQQQERLALFALEAAALKDSDLFKIPIEGYGDMQLSAQEYFDLAKAGIIDVSGAMTEEMGTILSDLGIDWEDMGRTSEENMNLLALRVQTVSGDIMDLGNTTDTESSAMKRDIERIEEAIRKSEGQTDDFADAIGDTGIDMNTLKETSIDAHNEMQKETKESIKAMGDLRDEIQGAIEAYRRLKDMQSQQPPGPVVPEVPGANIHPELQGNIPQAQAGIPYIPRTMPIIVHQQEAVLNPYQARQWRSGEDRDIHLHVGDVYGVDGLEEALENLLYSYGHYVR